MIRHRPEGGYYLTLDCDAAFASFDVMDKGDDDHTEPPETKVSIADPCARKLMVQYLSRRHSDIDILRSSLAAGDFEHIRNKGHNMYGSGSAYGLDRVSELGEALERAADDKESARVRRLIDMLEAFICNVLIV